MRPCRPCLARAARLLPAAALLLLGACASTGPSGPGMAARYPTFPGKRSANGHADPLVLGKRTRVAQEAARQVGQPHVRGAADSACGLVRAAYLATGLDVDRGATGPGGVERLYGFARARGTLHRAPRPNPGDLAFFNDTFDRNGDGLRNDPLTHVAVVERVDPDGTVVLVHRAGAGVFRQRMNLSHPRARRDPRSGKAWNHLLRRAGPGEPPRTTADLFAGFATLHLEPSAGTALASR